MHVDSTIETHPRSGPVISDECIHHGAADSVAGPGIADPNTWRRAMLAALCDAASMNTTSASADPSFESVTRRLVQLMDELI